MNKRQAITELERQQKLWKDIAGEQALEFIKSGDPDNEKSALSFSNKAEGVHFALNILRQMDRIHDSEE